MAVTVDLAGMTPLDKLRLMEDLSANEADLISPSWHGEILKERDCLIESGEEIFIDWEVAKKQLRAELQ